MVKREKSKQDSVVERDSSEDQKRNKGMTQGQSTQDIMIELDLVYFSSI